MAWNQGSVCMLCGYIVCSGERRIFLITECVDRVLDDLKNGSEEAGMRDVEEGGLKAEKLVNMLVPEAQRQR